MKTLIVEDDMMSQCLLAKVLAERGHEVVSYENAEQAILAYQKQFYPLMFVDVGLPGMDGLQFCKWVRGQPSGDKVFVMVATSSGQPADMNEVLAAGANDFLPKPYDATSLAVRLTIAEKQMKEFFERKEIEDSLRSSQENFHRVVKATNEGAWLFNSQFRTDYVNPQMAAIIGYPVEELANRAVIDFLPESAHHDAEELFTQQRDGTEVRKEFRFRRKDGSECLAFLSASPVRTENGEFKGSLWMVADLTDRQRQDAELGEVQKKFELQVHDLTSEVDEAVKSLQTERTERKKAEQALQQLRTDLEAHTRERSAERAKAADDAKMEAANRQKAEGETARVRDEMNGRVQEFTAELGKARDAFQSESARRQEVEGALQNLRKELDAITGQQKEELAKSRKELKAEQATRQHVEDALQKSRAETESRAKRHAEELAKAQQSLETEAAGHKQTAGSLQKVRQELETRLKSHAEELAKAERALQTEVTGRERAVEAVSKARHDLEAREKQHGEDLARAGRSLEAEISERKRLSESLQKIQHDLELRTKELTARLAGSNDELGKESAERKRVEHELAKVREELAHRVKEHAEELAKTRQELKNQRAECKRSEEELLKTREDFARRVKEHMAEMVKAGDELKAVLAERKKAENTLSKERDDAELKVNERTHELDKLRNQVKASVAERENAESALARTRAEAEARLKESTAELARLNGALKQRDEQIVKAAADLKTEASARRDAEEAFQKARQELETRLRELSAELDRSKRKSDEQASLAAKVHEDLAARTGLIEKTNDELKSEMAARKRTEACNAAFLKLARELSAARTPNDAARVVTGVAHELLGWDACSFDLYLAAENRIVPVLNIDVVNGRPAEVAPTYFGPEPSPIMLRVLKDGPQLKLRSGPSNSHTDYILFGDRAKLSASMMYVTVRSSDKPVGFLSLHSYAAGAYDPESLATLQALADHCGAAVERIRAEEAERRGDERFKLMARATNDVVRDWNVEGNRVWWNEGFERLFGYKADEIEAGVDSWFGRIHPEDKERVVTAVESLIKGGNESWSDEYRFRRRDGSYAHVLDRGYVIRDENNKALRVIGAMADVSQRKQTEAAMIEGQARKGAILEAALDAIVTIDHEGKVFEWNPAAEKMFGHRRAAVLGKDLADLIVPPSFRDRHRAGLSRFFGSGENESAMVGKRVELKAVRSDGTEFPIEMTVTRIATDGPPIFTGFIRDITQRLNLEAQLRQAQKMESIGQLAAGVAHDFNNLLSIVQGYSTLLLEDKDIKQETTDGLKQIASATERASHLTRQLLTFSRKQVIHVRSIDLNELVNNVGKLLRRAIGESIALRFNYSPGLPTIDADTGMMEQVVMNLAINARDAMAEGGQLTIATHLAEIDEARAQQNREARAGLFVCLTMSDTGCGMDEATLDRIFEPFFTTKPAGKGTGLGLATVYGIVKQHQGWIEVQSQVGRGTSFKVLLPAGSQMVAPAAQSADKPAVRGGNETILLVEDEPAVLTMAKGILQRLGYDVVTAPSGDEAITRWQEHSTKVDLLLTDMVMPGSLSGRELSEKLLKEKPALKVIYTSGYSMDLIRPGLATSSNFVFLQKPYHPETLARIVRNCLDGQQS